MKIVDDELADATEWENFTDEPTKYECGQIILDAQGAFSGSTRAAYILLGRDPSKTLKRMVWHVSQYRNYSVRKEDGLVTGGCHKGYLLEEDLDKGKIIGHLKIEGYWQ